MGKASGNKRFYKLFGFFSLALALAVLARFFYLMAPPGRRPRTYRDPEVSTELARGRIVDRDGRILAMDIPALRVAADPRRVEDPASAARGLSPVLGVPEEELEERLRRGSAYSVLLRRLDNGKKAALDEALGRLGLEGAVYTEPIAARFYPYGFHATQIIGFTDPDLNGLEGVELAFDKNLRAVPRLGPGPSWGDTVQLTLDMELQCVCDSIVQEMAEAHDPDWAVLVLLDARTGEVLASVSHPWRNPNLLASPSPESLQNKSFAFMVEPGSVFKVFSLAACLEAGSPAVLEPFDCRGRNVLETPLGREVAINCHEPHGTVDYKKMVALSCNGAAASYALGTPDEEFYEILRRFHFGEAYDLGLPNAPGRLSPPEAWSFRSKPTIAFGQEMMATGLQLASAATALCGGGLLKEPVLVRSVTDAEGRTVCSPPSRPPVQVVSASTAAKVLEAMETAAQEGGTAVRAAACGVRVAAKTGTAEILSSPSGAVTASTLAIFPADDPAYIVYIAASNPKGGDIWGANIASPAVGRLVEALCGMGRLAPSER